MHNHINARIERFSSLYRDFLKEKITTDPADAVYSIESLVNAADITGYPVFLLIDEYDNFANIVMMDFMKIKMISIVCSSISIEMAN